MSGLGGSKGCTVEVFERSVQVEDDCCLLQKLGMMVLCNNRQPDAGD